MSIDIKFKRSEFRHKYKGEVKFSEVDSFGVVHNLAYLYWLEWARTDYLFEIGLPKDNSIFSERMPLMTVNLNVDYLSSLKFTDIYTVLTKVGKIGKSSLRFDNLVISDDKLIMQGTTTLVYVKKDTGEPINLPDKIVDLIKKFENK